MKRFAWWFALMACMGSALAASWSTCDGVPVRPKYSPLGLFWDSCSMPVGSVQERAFFSGLFETRNYLHVLKLETAYIDRRNGVCVIEVGNDRSEVALVARSDIDGLAGATDIITDGCDFTGDEHIITADVKISADLDFTRADESTVISGSTAGQRIGGLVFLHELGHALGLEHTSSFATMRGGPTGVPFIGMLPGSGGLSAGFTGDDAFGMSRIYGVTPTYRNTYVSSQTLRNGALLNNDIDPDTNLPHADPLRVCPGDVVRFLSTVGNVSTQKEDLDLAIYADKDPNGYYFSPSDALEVFSVTINGRGTVSLRTDFTIPASLPTGVHHVFVSTQNLVPGERKAYDNFARSRLRIVRKNGC